MDSSVVEDFWKLSWNPLHSDKSQKSTHFFVFYKVNGQLELRWAVTKRGGEQNRFLNWEASPGPLWKLLRFVVNNSDCLRNFSGCNHLGNSTPSKQASSTKYQLLESVVSEERNIGPNLPPEHLSYLNKTTTICNPLLRLLHTALLFHKDDRSTPRQHNNSVHLRRYSSHPPVPRNLPFIINEHQFPFID